MLGTGMAQLLPLLASPVLSRLYDAHAFGVFGLFFSICAVTSVLASGRYELAVLLPKEEGDAYALTRLALALTVGVGLGLGVMGWVGADYWSRLFDNESIRPWLPWIAVGVVATSGYQVLNLWFNRHEKYRFMAGTRTLRSVVQVAVSVGFGLSHGVAGGLILGWLAGQVAGLVAFLYRFLRTTGVLSKAYATTDAKRMARRYIDFPLYSVTASTLNALTAQLPIWMLEYYFTTTVTGHVFFAQRTIAAPMGMISSAMGEVFKQRASVAVLEEGSCLRIWKGTFKALTLIALPIAAVVFLFGPDLFAWGFGEEWREAGEYARIMSPYLALGFVASPLSLVLYVAEKQSYDLLWQIALIISTFSALWFGSQRGNPRLALILHVTTYCILYVVYIAMSYRFARSTPPNSSTV